MVLELLLPYLLAFNRCKDSANRVKNQIYLSFSEMQPIFGGVIPPKIRLFPRISKDIRDLTFVESLSRLGRPQTSLGLLSLLGDFYPFVSVSCFWGVWHISSLLPQSITEMAVVGVTTAIRHLLAEAGGGGKYGLPPRARLQRDDYFFT